MESEITAKDLPPYPATPAVAEIQTLTERERMSDTIITQLRLLSEGLDLAAFERNFDQTLYEAYPNTAVQLIDFGLLHEKDGRLLLTKRGWFLSNQVFYRFM
jgi:oxygen-independent coproporphyrinogen-3 oxidase